MKKYLIGSVLLAFTAFAPAAGAVDYNTNASANTSATVRPAGLTVSPAASTSAGVLVPTNAVYTAAQIKEKIAAVKAQIAVMQGQLVRLESALKEAEAKGTVSIDTSASANTSIGVSATALGTSTLNLKAVTRALYYGQKGDDIKKLQEILKAKGYLSANADGSFGPKTLEAVAAYQRAMKLKVSGSVDADTLNSINASAAVSSSAETQ